MELNAGQQRISFKPNEQHYSMLNEPLPPTPVFRLPQNGGRNAGFEPPMPQSPTTLNGGGTAITSSHSPDPHRGETRIVGPSDHYGVHYSGRTNALTDRASNQGGATHETSLSSKIANYASQQSAQNVTRVYVIVDSRTPVMFKLSISPSRITLADLKNALPAINQPDFKYFFKSKDSEFGTVKEEIQDDDSKLPTDGNRVSVWIVTPDRLGDELISKAKSISDTCNLTCTTSYEDGSSSLMTTDMETTSYFTETDDNSTCCSNYSETTCDTFMSQRRNRHYRDRNGVRSPSHNYGRHEDFHSRSPHRYHERARDFSSSSSSSTTSSASQSDATAVHCLTVHLVLTNENFLGLHIYANDFNGVDGGIFVGGVTENSAVALDGQIEPGDKLMQVNEVNLEELTNEEAVEVLKEAVLKRGPLKLVVAKYVETNKNDDLDGIINPREAIHPIDTAAWVAHAQAITIPNSLGGDHASATSSPSYDSNAQDTDCIRPASASLVHRGSGLRLNRRTTDIKDIIQHMKIPEVGLNIKDREWLKIQIPKAFLGSDLVRWLERNVYGFENNREAKKFAARMLKEGYMRDPISKKSFSSKSYYTFVI